MRSVAVGALVVIGLIVIVLAAGFLLILYQGKRVPVGDPQYVAMGSSFAAGIGLGARAAGSPIACMRTVGGYPSRVSKLLNIPLVDVTCSAATTEQVLRGGQYFQRAQLDALRPETRLVTITSGGNDVRYVSDLSFVAARNMRSVTGWLMRRFWKGPLQSSQRDYGKVRQDLISFVRQVRRRSPQALVVIVTYPSVLPPTGTCPRLNLSEDEAGRMREVGEQLATVTREAAHESGATLVDMQSTGIDHHACSASPWVNGWVDAHGAQFHPTLAGAQAMAEAVAQAVRSHS
jgi:lysophospholipase L1-like esterase